MKDFLELDVRRREWPAARLIDVTLRDGGFRNRFGWTLAEMLEIASAVAASGVDCVELGYIGGVPELHGVVEVGPCADLQTYHVATIRQANQDVLLAAMVHPTAAPRDLRLAPYAAAGLDMVRLVYHSQWKDRFAALALDAREAGLQVSANIALASRYQMPEIVAQAAEIAALGVDILCFADTCAALVPAEAGAVAQALAPLGTIGFHGHDFLSLALANALAASAGGAEWIDASLWGIGRGAGNLRLELWLSLMAGSTGTNPDCLLALAPALELVEQRLGHERAPDLASIVAGAMNLTPPQEDQLRGPDGSLESAGRAAKLMANHAGSSTIAEALGRAPRTGQIP